LDTHKRTFFKTISWRVVATFTTAWVTFLLTGRLDFAISVGLADSILKFFIYYFHERLWSRTRFGQIRKPEYEISREDIVPVAMAAASAERNGAK